MEEPICAGLSHVVIKYKCLCHFFFKCAHQIYAGALIKCYFILEWAWGQGGGGHKNGLTKVSLHKPNYSAKIRNIAIAIFNALNN